MSATSEQTALRTLANYVAGEWTTVQGAETLDVRNPATGELLARVPLSGAADVDAAVSAARVAAAAWGQTSPLVRMRALMRLRDRLDERREEIARLVTLDMGKTIDDARGEVGRGIESVEAACGAPHLLKGENLAGVARGVDVELVREPVGVVAAITPFNFPAMIPLWFLPFAVATGNAVILKPSEQDPLASELILEIVDGVDELPPGVVSLVHGARAAVSGLLEHPGVDAVSFVGSAATAQYVAETAIAHGKRVQALGGAKNALVVMPDADPSTMAAGVCASAFGAAGQRCLAGSIAVLVGERAEQQRSLELILAAARELRVGDGADPAVDVCPLVSPAARERVEGEIAAALEEGCELVLDGRQGGGAGGAELGPTIVDGAAPDSRMIREEIFGPVLALARAENLEGALELVNASRYGNSSVIFTSSGGSAREFRAQVQAGMVGVNIGVAAPVAWFPFAGWKDSFAGDLHANGHDAFDFYTRRKVITSRW
ncbi:MAG TPA: CoA-acylating methylmalonate-semialdehyde dehydrogenase [Solirubrobacteraceae bacterium]|nr:CoA-acylating methylmalonate-semialdehyde dehydrogenase [Solirubrobacteraceae bacterium]